VNEGVKDKRRSGRVVLAYGKGGVHRFHSSVSENGRLGRCSC
jgi:hypothetical protein